METKKLKFFQEKLTIKVLEKAQKKSFIAKFACCILRGGQAGNLQRIAVFDQRGPPPEASGWYLVGSQNTIPCKSYIMDKGICA